MRAAALTTTSCVAGFIRSLHFRFAQEEFNEPAETSIGSDRKCFANHPKQTLPSDSDLSFYPATNPF
jgi:hypothetical protein